MKTAIETGMDWLMNKKPEVAFLIVILVCSGSVMGSYYAFVNRIDKVEARLDGVEARIEKLESECKDIRTEIKEFRAEVDVRFEKVDQRFDKVEADLVDIKLILKKIDTYISTKDPNYK